MTTMTCTLGTRPALSALLLICYFATTACALSVHAPSQFRRSLLTNPPAPSPTNSDISATPNRATDNPATASGLQDTASSGTTVVTVGHYIDNAGLKASTSYTTGPGGVKTSSSGVWGQTFTYSAVSVNGDARTDIFESSTGITVDSVKFNQKNNMWMLDTALGTAYKIDCSASGASTGATIGVFQTSPSE